MNPITIIYPLHVQIIKFNISFFNLQTNIILQNLKQTLTCTNHKFIQQI